MNFHTKKHLFSKAKWITHRTGGGAHRRAYFVAKGHATSPDSGTQIERKDSKERIQRQHEMSLRSGD